MIRYVYPKLPALRTTPFFRIGGIGLANALFVYSRALLLAEDNGLEIIDPPWFSIRKPKHWFSAEKDARHYSGIFKSIGLNGWRKAWLMTKAGRISEDEFKSVNVPAEIVVVSRIVGKGFAPIRERHGKVLELLRNSVRAKVLDTVDSFDFSNAVAVHVRRGDYTASRRTPDAWFCTVISVIKEAFPSTRFLLFSDGSQAELRKLLKLPDVEPVFFGCSMSDIFAISRCCALIGSCSTFSDWGAFLGQIPALFPAPPQFGHVHCDVSHELVAPTPPSTLPVSFYQLLSEKFRDSRFPDRQGISSIRNTTKQSN